MTTPEKKVKDKVKAILKELGVYYFMPATHGYGSSGVPDIVACINGRFIGIECKAGDGKPTALQIKNLTDIMNSGGVSIVINEQEIGALRLFLNTLALTKTVAGMLTDYTNWGKK